MSLSKENKTTLAIAGAVGAAALAGLGYYFYRNSSTSKGAKQGKALPPNSVSVTCTAPVNIAVIKYWGKRDDEVSKKLIIPVNSSLSATIDQDSMCSTTTITATKSDKPTYTMCLNGKEESVYDNKRLLAVINAMIPIAKAFTTEDGKEVVGAAEWPQYSLRIESVNNFPTAAGLASSASGYACLTFTLAALFGVAGPETDHANREWLSTYARQGSGSACRSLEGGFVQWIKGGDAKDGSDSIARQVVSQAHWPDIRILILVVNASKKETSSTDGMQESVRTSDFLKYRAATQVPERMKAMITALEQRDFHTFADLTMRDSNSFHSVCLDTLPPITYMNATSHRIAAMVHAVNKSAGAKNIAAYTYDAGPNAVVFTTAQHMDTLLATFKHYFAPTFGGADFVFDPLRLHDAKRADAAAGAAWVKAIGEKNAAKDQIKQIIVSRPGPGPKVIAKAQNIVAAPAAAAGAGAGAKK